MIKTLLLMSFTFLQAFPLFARNVGIGITAPDQSAIVDMSANNKGLLIPMGRKRKKPQAILAMISAGWINLRPIMTFTDCAMQIS